MKIIYECRNFIAPPPPPPPPPQRRRSAIDIFFGGNNACINPDTFVPLDVIIQVYMFFCQHHKTNPIDFREYCPLPIVRMHGPVSWRPIHDGPERYYENPEVVMGVSLVSCCDYTTRKMKNTPTILESLEAFMSEWDGQCIRFTTMFQNLRTRFPGVFFKYPHLVDSLRTRGCIVDNAGFVVAQTNLPRE